MGLSKRCEHLLSCSFLSVRMLRQTVQSPCNGRCCRVVTCMNEKHALSAHRSGFSNKGSFCEGPNRTLSSSKLLHNLGSRTRKQSRCIEHYLQTGKCRPPAVSPGSSDPDPPRREQRARCPRNPSTASRRLFSHCSSEENWTRMN